MKIPAPLMWRLIRLIRIPCTPRCGKPAKVHGKTAMNSTARVADCSNPPTAAPHGTNSRADCLKIVCDLRPVPAGVIGAIDAKFSRCHADGGVEASRITNDLRPSGRIGGGDL